MTKVDMENKLLGNELLIMAVVRSYARDDISKTELLLGLDMLYKDRLCLLDSLNGIE